MDTQVCSACKKPHAPGYAKKVCATCLAWHKAYRAKRREVGLCPCGRPLRTGTTACDVCWDRRIASQAKLREKRRAAGICTHCKMPAGRNAATCKACSDARVQSGRAKLGVTREVFTAMKAAQGGACDICGDSPDKLCVDHNHATGKVRAILCDRCNRCIGLARESPVVLRAMADYVERHDA